MLHKIRTVLIHNSHPGNIGSSARAMKNMGLETLYLVAPKRFPAKEAFYMASRADDIVERAVVVENVHQALEGCTLVFGASSRTRALKWHEISPREAARKIITELMHNQGQVAMLYGCEQNGLSNEELELSHYQIVIPAIPEYASLNVAQAVQLISYEIYVAYLDFLTEQGNAVAEQGNAVAEQGNTVAEQGNAVAEQGNDVNESGLTKDAPYANSEEMERFYKHLEETLYQIQFIFEDRPGLMMSRLRRLFAAARLDKIELQILRGILTAMQKCI